MIIPGIIASLLSIGYFYFFIQYLQLRSLSFPEKMLFSIGGAVGLQSLFMLLGLFFLGSVNNFLIVCELLFFGVCCVIVYLKSHKERFVCLEPHNISKLGAILSVCFAGTLLQWGMKLLKVMQLSPHGEWDAWTIWNMRSRILFRSEEDWRRAFDSVYAWSHPDYPLLISNTVVRIWNYLGFETQWVPALLGTSFMLATILLLFFGLQTLTTLGQAAVMGITLMMFSAALLHSGWQYADTPLSFYLLATTMLFAHYDREGSGNRNFILIAGMFAGFAAWTKNEGILFIVIVIVVRGLLALKGRTIKRGFSELVYFICGILPVLLARIYQGTLAPGNELLTKKKGELLEYLCDSSRYQVIGNRFMQEYLGIEYHLLIVLVGLFLFFPVRHFWRKPECMMPILLFSGMIFGYFGVYLITPHNLNWHLSTSLSRLIYQLWPLLVFVFAMLIKPPEEIFKDPVQACSLHKLWSHLQHYTTFLKKY